MGMGHRTSIGLALVLASGVGACGGDSGDADAARPDGHGPETADAATDGALPADAAGPDSSVMPADSPIWFVHVTDTHFGQGDAPALAALLQNEIDVFQPAATIHSGDLVDDGGEADQWAAYRSALAGGVPAYPEYFEIPGNHDVKNGGLPSFLSESQTGRAGGGAYGLTDVAAPAGTVRIVRVNTADSDSTPVVLAGFVTAEQADALTALPLGGDDVALRVVAAHHPIGILAGETMNRVRSVIDHFGAPIYFCGHLHFTNLAWLGNTLVVQGPRFGDNPTEMMLVAWDATGPAARAIPLDATATPNVQWPVVLITSPANAGLGITNPYATPYPAGTSATLRALAFAPDEVTSAEYRFDEGDWQPLAAVAGPLWSATIAMPAAGSHAIEVRASVGGTATGTDEISVSVE